MAENLDILNTAVSLLTQAAFLTSLCRRAELARHCLFRHACPAHATF
jgi:hypothetical protein